MRQTCRAEYERKVERQRLQRDFVFIPRVQECLLRRRSRLHMMEHLGQAEIEFGEYDQRDDERAGHERHGLRDLNPTRGMHAAEDNIDRHEHADNQHGRDIVQSQQSLISAPAPTSRAIM